MKERSAVRLRLFLLGTASVQWDDLPLRIPRRQVRALLYYLGTEGRPTPRERLCYLLWSDVADSKARRNLSHLLSHLRKALPASDLLSTVEDRVYLDPQRLWTDVAAFEKTCAEGQKPDGTRSMRSRGEAIALYRGPFLAGFSLHGSREFEGWVTHQRRIYERLYLEALSELIEMHTEAGEYEAAIDYARRYLEVNELAEEMHRTLMNLYAAIGDRGAVLRHFERCTVILERELGVSPLAETRAIYDSVLEGSLASSNPPSKGYTWTVLPSLDLPLIGRDEVWQRLQRAFTRTQSGTGQVLLLFGEPGIGKSRLLRDFTRHVEGKATILAGTGQPVGQDLPYYPLIQALRGALRASDKSTLPFASLAPTWVGELSRLLPELRERRSDYPPPLRGRPEEARTRLLEALYRTLLALAGGSRPLVFCLDDLHWMDAATLDWLAYLGPRIRDQRVLILGTYRSEEREALKGLHQNLTRLGLLQEIRLTGLGEGSIARLVGHLPGSRSGNEALATRLQEITGGNPFFLLEILRVLTEEGRLPPDLEEEPGETFPLPDTVRQVVTTRLARLSTGARQILQAAAILGGTFGFEQVHRTAGRGEMETLNGLEELVARQLLVEQEGPSRGGVDASPGTMQGCCYRFRHELIRQTTEAALNPMRRQLLHSRAGRALEALEPDAAATLARHFEEGGIAEKALRYYGEAVEKARELFAWGEVERYQSRRLDLLDWLDSDRSDASYVRQRGEILASRAHARHLQGRLEDRDADLSALVSLSQASGDCELQLLSYYHRLRYLNVSGKYHQAVALGEKGLILARDVGDVHARSRILAHMGFAHYFLGHPKRALDALESAMEVSDGQMDLEMRGRITHILGYVYYHLADYGQALAYHQKAYDCVCQIRDHNRMAWNLMDVGYMYLKLGRFGLARDCLDESLALARRIAARPAEAYVLTLLGDWELYRGHYVRATRWFRESLSVQVEVDSKHGIVAAEDGAGFATYHLGVLDGAREKLQRALELARRIDHQRHVALSLIGLGLVALSEGSSTLACRRLEKALTVARVSRCPENVTLALCALTWVERNEGDVRTGLEHAREAIAISRDCALSTCHAWAESELGLTVLATGNAKQALEHTAWAVTALPRMHEAWIGSEQIHRAHAEVLRALGRIEEAHEQVRLAAVVTHTKASRIPDPDARQRFLQHVKRQGASLSAP